MVATDYLPPDIAHVRGRLDTDTARVRVLDLSWSEPISGDVPASDDYLIDFCPRRRTPDAEGRYTGAVSTRTYSPLGQLYVVPAGQTLTARSGSGRHRVWMCWLRRDLIAAILGRDLDWTEGRLDTTLNLPCLTLATTLRRLIAELDQPGFAHDVMVTALIDQLSIDLCRVLQLAPVPAAASGLAPWRLRIVDERMREAAPPGLDELAALCGLSTRQLTRSYRISRNSSIARDMGALRIARARRMLEDGSSVKETAFTLGFASTSSFCQAFKAATGQRAGELRGTPGIGH